MSTDASNAAPASVVKPRQRATAASHSAPRGARGLPSGMRTWSRPGRSCRRARRPRSTCCILSCAPPSRARECPSRDIRSHGPCRPTRPRWPMIARIKSLAVTPAGSSPSTLIAKVFGLRCSRHCVANTWPTSVLPIPKARAPKAPWVLVWLSPQTMVMPGSVSAELRTDDVHDAAPRIAHAEQLERRTRRNCRSSCSTCLAAASSRDRHRAEHLFAARRRRVIHGGQRAFGAAHRQPERS